jgi:hypothetical protein
MSDIPGFPYADLWGERSIRSVANLTRQDGIEFLDLAPRIPVRTSVTVFPLEEANAALAQLRRARCRGLRCWRWTGPECRIARGLPRPRGGLVELLRSRRRPAARPLPAACRMGHAVGR